MKSPSFAVPISLEQSDYPGYQITSPALFGLFMIQTTVKLMSHILLCDLHPPERLFSAIAGLKMPSLNFTTGEDPLSLERIRSVLIRLEDTIIFSLIERAQFAHNPRIYQKGVFEELSKLGFHGSWLEWFLKETEYFHGPFIASWW